MMEDKLSIAEDGKRGYPLTLLKEFLRIHDLAHYIILIIKIEFKLK
jgi:hypothetical protein